VPAPAQAVRRARVFEHLQSASSNARCGLNRGSNAQPLQTWVIKTADFRLPKPLPGIGTFAEGELIALDGDEEVPTRKPVPEREGLYLARPLN
jgi:hypothetical protein